MGLHQAGFEVTGVDFRPQPHYPFQFHEADALEFPLDGYDCYWASPPCQLWCRMRKLNISQNSAKDYPDLIERIRGRLKGTGKPYVIENVPRAPLLNAARLCGSFFGLPLRRHRLFETSFSVMSVPCAHYAEVADKPCLYRLSKSAFSRVVGCYGNGKGKGDNKELWASAMGIDWMSKAEMAQAIPPVYSEYIGKYMIESILT